MTFKKSAKQKAASGDPEVLVELVKRNLKNLGRYKEISVAMSKARSAVLRALIEEPSAEQKAGIADAKAFLRAIADAVAYVPSKRDLEIVRASDLMEFKLRKIRAAVLVERGPARKMPARLRHFASTAGVDFAVVQQFALNPRTGVKGRAEELVAEQYKLTADRVRHIRDRNRAFKMKSAEYPVFFILHAKKVSRMRVAEIRD